MMGDAGERAPHPTLWYHYLVRVYCVCCARRLSPASRAVIVPPSCRFQKPAVLPTTSCSHVHEPITTMQRLPIDHAMHMHAQHEAQRTSCPQPAAHMAVHLEVKAIRGALKRHSCSGH